MLRVTIEVVPFGIEENKRAIHTIEIGNQGTQTKAGRHRYKAIFLPQPFELGTKSHIARIAHFREDGALRLARMALQRAEGIFSYQGSQNS